MAVQREWLEKDYYKVLGVPKTASDKDVTRAYRKLAKQYHPDANPGSEERFKEISAAYEVIGDHAKRKEYDEVRTMSESGFAGNPFAAPAAAGRGYQLPGGRPGRPVGQYLRPRRPRRGRHAPAAGAAQRGQDIEAELHLSFADAVKGATTTVNVTSEARALPAADPGRRRGARPPCARCAVAGVCQRKPGHVLLQPPVRGVRRHGDEGRGAVPRLRRPRRPRSAPGRSRSGSRPGSRTASGSGSKAAAAAGRHGGPPGDLYVVVRIDRHPFSPERQGPDGEGPGDLCRGGPGHHRVGAHPQRQGGHPQGPARDPLGQGLPGGRPGCPRRGQGRGDLLVTFEVEVPDQIDATRSGPSRLWPGSAEATASDRNCGRAQEPPTADTKAPRRPAADRPAAAKHHVAVYVISVAAELAGVHPQTLRIYERKGLLGPARTRGGSRRYSDRHRAAAPDPGPDGGRPQPGGRPPGDRAGGRGFPPAARGGGGAGPRPRSRSRSAGHARPGAARPEPGALFPLRRSPWRPAGSDTSSTDRRRVHGARRKPLDPKDPGAFSAAADGPRAPTTPRSPLIIFCSPYWARRGRPSARAGQGGHLPPCPLRNRVEEAMSKLPTATVAAGPELSRALATSSTQAERGARSPG